ncbi:MAG: 4-(cytidine 5'-diphospho)-2-C-methyl-D-erythritol kinase [Sedimentisphaerales bacterium]|nr:4-(cytidine 5'-diphospho)-2-C-methyl-D-erythritol kinase [Sedimentisphaerales bacterium]
MANVKQLEQTPNGLIVRAPAKINLCLLIGGKRPDGFHEIKTIMAKVDWFDELLFQETANDGIELICAGKYWAPQDKTNLVYRAIELFAKETGIAPKVKVTLTKNIPAGSGLGSASSDAAAALIGFNHLTKAALSLDRLAALAAALGSDVPFFLGGPLALCTGRGEKICQISKKFDFLSLLVLPNINTSTKSVYENYTHDPVLFYSLNSRMDSFLAENKVDLIAKMCENMLTESCFALHREIASLKTKIEQLEIAPLCLSGSGSTLFCIIENHDLPTAQCYQRIIKETIGCDSVLACSNSW